MFDSSTNQALTHNIYRRLETTVFKWKVQEPSQDLLPKTLTSPTTKHNALNSHMHELVNLFSISIHKNPVQSALLQLPLIYRNANHFLSQFWETCYGNQASSLIHPWLTEEKRNRRKFTDIKRSCSTKFTHLRKEKKRDQIGQYSSISAQVADRPQHKSALQGSPHLPPRPEK